MKILKFNEINSNFGVVKDEYYNYKWEWKNIPNPLKDYSNVTIGFSNNFTIIKLMFSFGKERKQCYNDNGVYCKCENVVTLRKQPITYGMAKSLIKSLEFKQTAERILGLYSIDNDGNRQLEYITGSFSFQLDSEVKLCSKTSLEAEQNNNELVELNEMTDELRKYVIKIKTLTKAEIKALEVEERKATRLAQKKLKEEEANRKKAVKAALYEALPKASKADYYEIAKRVNRAIKGEKPKLNCIIGAIPDVNVEFSECEHVILDYTPGLFADIKIQVNPDPFSDFDNPYYLNPCHYTTYAFSENITSIKVKLLYTTAKEFISDIGYKLSSVNTNGIFATYANGSKKSLGRERTEEYMSISIPKQDEQAIFEKWLKKWKLVTPE